MPDANHDPGISVPQALRSLPLETPDASALPMLRNEFRRARQRRVGMAFAAAAALAAIALLPMLSSLPGPASPDEPRIAQASPELQQLMNESTRIESLLQRLRDPALASASDVLLDLAFEDRLQQIDMELADEALAPTRRSDLWRLRIALLRSSVELESARRLLAAENDGPRPALVSAQ